MSALTIFILRKKVLKTSENLYTIGFGKVLFPIIFMVIYTLVALASLYNNSDNLPIAIGLFLGGLPLYYLIKKIMLQHEK